MENKENTPSVKKKINFKRIFKITMILSIGVFVGMLLSLFTAHIVEETSDEKFCGSCHTMEPMIKAFKNDIHGGNNRVGFRATCTDCHLPHDNVVNYMTQKSLTGMHDVWVETFGDTKNIDWEKKREHRKRFVYDSGCLRCHKDKLLPNVKTKKLTI
jgi:cytochrome c-type protein NapC